MFALNENCLRSLISLSLLSALREIDVPFTAHHSKKSTIKTKNKQQKSEKNCLRSKKEHKNVGKEGTQEQKR